MPDKMWQGKEFARYYSKKYGASQKEGMAVFHRFREVLKDILTDGEGVVLRGVVTIRSVGTKSFKYYSGRKKEVVIVPAQRRVSSKFSPAIRRAVKRVPPPDDFVDTGYLAQHPDEEPTTANYRPRTEG